MHTLEQVREAPQRVPLSSWNPPPESLRVKSDEVQVWRAALDPSAARVHEKINKTVSFGDILCIRLYLNNNLRREILGNMHQNPYCG